jgi:hypothetical protein
LERRLGRLSAKEARRSRKLTRTQQRILAVETRLRALRESSVAAGAAPGVPGYCLRERRRVVVAGAELVTLRNGRAALAGTCPDCGARIISMAVRASGIGAQVR